MNLYAFSPWIDCPLTIKDGTGSLSINIEFKNGKLKIISFFAKKARGSMVRFILDHNVTSLEQLKNFNTDGYGFSNEHTLNENEPVFIR